MNTIEILTFIYNLLMLITLIVLVWQAYLQRKQNNMNALEQMYDRYFDFGRLVIDHPELQLYTARVDALDAISKLNKDELKKRAYIELILDCHELMFIKQTNGYYKFQEDYLLSLMANPHVIKYWQTMRGNYRQEFIDEINRLINNSNKSK